jgi:hypothetical protein
MYKNPEIKITQVLIMDNKLMYKNPEIKTTQVLIVYKMSSCTKILE